MHRPHHHALRVLLCIIPALLVATARPRSTASQDAQEPGEAWTYLANTNRITAIALDATDNEIWSASNGGVVRWDLSAGTSAHVTTKDGLASNDVRAVATIGRDTWFGTAAGLSLLTAKGDWATYRVGDGLAHDDIQTLEVGPEGELWIGTWGGISVREPDGTFRSYTMESTGEKLPSNHILSMFIGQDERWIGTWNGGLVHWRSTEEGDDWRTYETDTLEEDGHTLVSDNIPAIAVDSASGDLWVASAGRWDPDLQLYFPGALSRMTPEGDWSFFDREMDLISESIHDLSVDSNGLLWIGSDGGASNIRIAAGTGFTHITSEHGLAHDRVAAIVFAPAGDIYFGTGNGISRLEPSGRWTHLAGDVQLPSNSVTALALDGRRQHAWFGTQEGVARLDASKAEMEVIHPIGGRYANWINDIAIDADGTAWLATGLYDPTFRASQRYHGGGVVELRPDGDQIRHTRALPGEDGLPHDLVFDVEIDAKGNKWFGTWQGLGRLGADGVWLPAIHGPQAQLRVDGEEHPALEGMIGLPLASFGVDGISGELAVHGFACFHTFETPVEDVTGKIALIEQGNCWSSDNLETAERNGAIAALIYAGPNGPPTRMMGNDRGIGIPGVMIDREVGEALRARRANSETIQVRIAAADPDQGLVSDDIRAIAHVEGGTWLGTWGGGAAFVDANQRITSYTTASTDGGLSDDRVISIAESPNGEMWFGTERGGLSRRARDGSWLDPLTEDSTGGQMLGDRVTALLFDEEDSAWIGLSGRADPDSGDDSNRPWLRGGLNQLDPNGTWSSLRSEDGLPDDNVLSLAAGADGQLLIGTHGGAYMREWQTNGSCDRARPISTETHVEATFSRPIESHYYRFEVERPHSHVEISVTDPKDELELRLIRTCKTIDSDSGRKISPGPRVPSGEQRLVRDLGSDTGVFYIEVTRHAPAGSGPVDYTLRVDVAEVALDSVRSLLLTNLDQLRGYFGDDPAAAADLDDALSSLAADPRVRGRLVTDLQGEVGGAYQSWVQEPGDPAVAKAAARALRDWIWQQRRQLPHLRYIVLVGDDRVIPHYRQNVPAPPGTEWSTESDYLSGGTSGTIPSDSSIYRALAVNLTLSDDFYATARGMAWAGDQEIFIPELAIGRLVESPSDMVRVIDAFLHSAGVAGAESGTIAPRPIRRSLVAGWDFMQDGPEEGARRLEAAGHRGQVERLLGDSWPAAQLEERLRARRYDLAFLGMHANHFAYSARTGALRAETIRDMSTDMEGTLAYSLSCHGGLNVPGKDDRREGEPVDLPEAWLGSGANYISSTGWAYGMEGALGYQEALMVDFTSAIAEGGGTAIGDALMRVKQEYFTTHDMNPYHAKTLVGTVLYGLPMASYRLSKFEQTLYLPQLSLSRGGASPEPFGGVRGNGGGRHTGALSEASIRDVEPVTSRLTAPRGIFTKPQAVQQTPGRPYKGGVFFEELRQHFDRHDSAEGSYFTIGQQRPFAENGLAVQPKLTQELPGVTIGDVYRPLRGVLLSSADYLIEPLDAPVIARAGILGAPAMPAAQADPPPTWLPSTLMSVRRLDPDRYSHSPTLLVYLGQYHAGERRQRLYDRVEMDTFYSTSSDHSPPRIIDVQVARAPDGAELTARVSDESGVDRVRIACDDGAGHWRSRKLDEMPEDGAWQGRLSADESCIVQAVDGAGNTATDDRAGELYQNP